MSSWCLAPMQQHLSHLALTQQHLMRTGTAQVAPQPPQARPGERLAHPALIPARYKLDAQLSPARYKSDARLSSPPLPTGPSTAPPPVA